MKIKKFLRQEYNLRVEKVNDYNALIKNAKQSGWDTKNLEYLRQRATKELNIILEIAKRLKYKLWQ
jgi:hypothetical protein